MSGHANLLKLLRSRDSALVDQGVELAVALQDPMLFDDLLAGVTYGQFTNPRRFRDREPRWIFVPNTLFNGPRTLQPTLDRAIVMLVALAPAESRVARELREGVVELRLEGPPEGAPYDLGWFASFPNLKRLHLANVRPLKGLDRVQNIEELTVQGGVLPNGLVGLDAPGLKSLTLMGVSCGTLEGIREAPGLTILRLHGQGSCDISALSWASSLQACSLSGFSPVGRLDWRRLDALEELALHGFAPGSLQHHPTLRSLTLTDPPHLPVLADLPALEHLRLSLMPEATNLEIPAFSNLPRLCWLELEAELLSDLRGLSNLPALQILDLRTHAPALVGLSELPLQSLTLTASSIPSVQLPETLHEVSICAPLLRGISLPSAIQKLYLPGCSALESLNVRALAALQELSVDGCSSLQVLTGTGALNRLETLDLRGTRSLREVPLLGMSIRAVAIDGSALARHHFPAPSRPLLTTDPQADLAALSDVDPPALARKREDSHFHILLRRLRIRDLAAIDAAVADLTASLEGAPERRLWFDRILAGTRVVSQTSAYSRKEGETIVPGPLLKGTRVEAPYREHAVRVLVAAAPPASKEAQALRQSIHHLHISGHITLRREPDAAVDVSMLPVFSHLSTLCVEAAHPLLGQSALGRVPLTSLELLDCVTSDLGSLPDTLKYLRVSGIIGLTELPSLEHLTSLTELEIERLEVADIRSLGTLPRLKRLRIRHLPKLWDISVLSSFLSLESLEMEELAVVSLLPIARLPRLSHLTLTGLNFLSDLNPLAMTRLSSVNISRLYRVKDFRILSRIPTLSTLITDTQHG